MSVLHRLASVSTVLSLGLLGACAYPGGNATQAPEAAAAEASQAQAAQAAAQAALAPVPAAPVTPQAAPGEAALADGVKAYQSGQYKQAETQLTAALKAGLTAPADLVAAHKHLAFIYCTSKRDSLCAASFKAAKAADPAFALSKAEAGHPMWSKTYKRALGLK
jgi:hypothetical protein